MTVQQIPKALLQVFRYFISKLSAKLYSYFKNFDIAGTLTKDDRSYLYSTLEASIEANTPLTEIFDDLVEENVSKPLTSFSRNAKRGILEQDDFTFYLSETNYLPPEELKILTLGVKYESLGLISTYLSKQLEKDRSFLKKLLSTDPSSLFTYPMALLLTVVGSDFLSGLRRMRGDETPLFFVMADFVNANLFFLVGIPCIAIFLHAIFRKRAFKHRATLQRFGVYKMYDMEQELKIIELCAALVPLRMTPMELVDALISVFNKDKNLMSKLSSARLKAQETSLIDIFSFFVSKAAFNKMKSKAPTNTPQEISEGFLYSSRLMSNRYELISTQFVHFANYVSFFAGMILIVPFLMVVTGL